MSLYQRLLKRLDWHLLLSVFGLIIIGLIILYSASFDQTTNPANALTFMWKQLFALSLGLILMWVMLSIDYHLFEKYAEVIYIIMLGFLLLVIGIGHTATGAQRWLHLGMFSIQPSEMAKLALLVILAKYLSARSQPIQSLFDILPLLGLTLIPFVLIFKQPDLGTSLIFIFLFFTMQLWAGTQPLLLLLLASPLISIAILFGIPHFAWLFWVLYLIGILMLMHYRTVNLVDSAVFFISNVLTAIVSPVLWNTLKFYQQQRLLGFLNPAIDPLGQSTRYHATKSVIAIGSGGFWGQGYLNGPLTHLQYIPEHHTDFIFTVIGEEFGLIGAVLVLLLFGYILIRAIHIATNAQDKFGSILAAGIASLLALQIIINIGMTVGFFPVVGIPLPFMSAGGSALISNLIAIGILESIAIHQKKLFF